MEFPNELKMSKVILFYKSGDKTDITNYRPISVLPLFAQIFEQIMCKHFINFIDKHNILYNYQFVFRKSHSTNHANILSIDKINNALDLGYVLIEVFVIRSHA